MTILSDVDIKRYIVSENIVENIGDLEEQLQPASLDVRLGDTFLRPAMQVGTATLEDPSSIQYVQGSGQILLEPGDFVLATTMERVNLPDNIVAVVNGRSTLGRLGVTVHVTAGYVDPGFQGTITLEIFNCGPSRIMLFPGDRVAQLVFDKLSTPARRPYGSEGSNNKYQNQSRVTAPRSDSNHDTIEPA